MAPKKKKKGHGRRSKTPAQTSASDPKPTTTSPSTSTPTDCATTTSLVPSSAFPSAPPTTTTTQVIPSAPPQPTSLLPSSTSQITTTQPLPSAPPLSIQEIHQERITCTSDGATTSDLAGPSTAPSTSAESTRTPTLLPVTHDFMRFLAPAVAAGAMAAKESVKEEDTARLQEMVVALLGLQLNEMESVVESLLGLANEMKGEVELKMASETLANMEVIKSGVGLAEKLLYGDISNPEGSGGSCGGSQGEGSGPDSGPDSGSSEDGGEGGGVGV